MRFNSYSELVDYLNKKDCYEPFIIEEVEKYIIQNNNIFVENEIIEPTKLVNLNIKGRSFSYLYNIRREYFFLWNT